MKYLEKINKKKENTKEIQPEFVGAMVITDHLGNEQVISFRDKIKLEIYGDIKPCEWRFPNQSYIQRFGSKRDVTIEANSIVKRS